MKVSEALEVKKGMPLDEIEGIIKNVFPMEQKDWGSQQNIVITDGLLTILCQLCGCEEVKDEMKGQRFYAVAWNSPKHGFTGLKMNEYTNKAGKIVKQLKITKSAKVQIGSNLPKADVITPHNHTIVSATKPTAENPSVVKTAVRENYRTNPIDVDGIKNRSMSISYAKDLCCDSKIQVDELFDFAGAIYTYIINGLEPVKVPESQDVRELNAQNMAEENDEVTDALNNDDGAGEEEIPF